MASPGEDVQAWSTTAATNATADPLINWAEGQPRASVNNSARAQMAAHAKKRNLENGSITTGGTANAQTFTSGVSYTTVPTGLTVRLKIGATNTGATTLNMDSIGAVAIKDQAGFDIGANALTLGRYADLLYNGTNWILLQTGAAAAPFDALAYNGLQVNGSMEVSQENDTTAVILTPSVQKYVIDGFSAVVIGTGSFTVQQLAITSLPGFSFAIQMFCGVATTNAGITDGQYFYQPVEGYRWSRLAFGTASAQAVTIGFWVFTNVTGTMALSVRNNGSTRSYVADVPVTAANAWQFKTVTIPGDVAGTWSGGIATGAFIGFSFGAGSARKTTANIWTAGDFTATPATTNFFATTGTCFLTGVVILPGSDAPSAERSPFIVRPYDQELPMCQRYYHKKLISMIGDATAGLPIGQWIPHPVFMRSAPTMAATGGSFSNCAGPGALDQADIYGYRHYINATATGTVSLSGLLITADARL
jgi:hypothetical protein